MENNLVPSIVSSNDQNQGNIELQMPSLDTSMQVFTRENVFGDASSVDTTLFDDDKKPHGGGFPLSSGSSPFNLQTGHYEVGNSSFDELLQLSNSLNRKPPPPHSALGFSYMVKTRRLDPHEENNNYMLDPKQNIWLTEFRANTNNGLKMKKPDASSSSFKKLQHSKGNLGKRHQKLAQKIPVLQKLVSPYGKRDTASVLQEASLYIRLVQGQIQELYRNFLRSYDMVRATHSQPQGIQEERRNLRSKGLCLVPSSFSQNLTKKS